FCGGLHALTYSGRQPWMHNLVQFPHPPLVEGLLGEIGAIQGATLFIGAFSKSLCQPAAYFLIRDHQFFSQFIGVEDIPSHPGPNFADRGLAASDASRNADRYHYSVFSVAEMESRYSLMNSSISPSITPSVSEVSKSVR